MFGTLEKDLKVHEKTRNKKGEGGPGAPFRLKC